MKVLLDCKLGDDVGRQILRICTKLDGFTGSGSSFQTFDESPGLGHDDWRQSEKILGLEARVESATEVLPCLSFCLDDRFRSDETSLDLICVGFRNRVFVLVGGLYEGFSRLRVTNHQVDTVDWSKVEEESLRSA